jgi:alpha-beta hydrolase superfamily lysophospholipase
MANLAASGISCFAYDQRGHGLSPGAPVDIEHFSQFADDFAAIRAGVAAQNPRLPVFLWGHSLGSIVALCSVLDQRNPLAGVITTGCPVCAVPALPVPVWAVARKLAGTLPTWRVRPGLSAVQLSHDRRVQQDYLLDPLVRKEVTLRLIVELASACRYVLLRAPSIRAPWLAIHGGEDSVAPPRGSRRLIERLSSPDRQLLVQPGLFHEVHNETEPAASRFCELISRWIGDRTALQQTEN